MAKLPKFRPKTRNFRENIKIYGKSFGGIKTNALLCAVG